MIVTSDCASERDAWVFFYKYSDPVFQMLIICPKLYIYFFFCSIHPTDIIFDYSITRSNNVKTTARIKTTAAMITTTMINSKIKKQQHQ